LGLLVVAAGSQAQVRPKETTNTALTGQIKAIDAAKKTLTIEGANKEGGVYQVTDKTTIMDNSNKTIDLGGLKTGWWVAVTVDTVTGKNVATYIEVVDTP
jgi:Cu/Ag efflux protein CusF